MVIDGGLRDSLAVGTRLVARYKHEEHMAEVVAGEDGKARYRLADGRTFKSPSAAASAVMNGQAANGWRFWSIEGETSAPAPAAGVAAAQTPDEAAAKVPDEGTAKARPQCPRCGKSFVGAAQLSHHEANADRLCTPA